MRLWMLPCLGLMALAACQSGESTDTMAESTAALDSWMGASEQEVIAAWGTPSITDPMADGSKILQYLQTQERLTAGSARLFPPQTTFQHGLYDRFRPRDELPIDNEYDSTISGLRDPGALVELCRTRFTISPEGTVQAVYSEGGGCSAAALPRSTG